MKLLKSLSILILVISLSCLTIPTNAETALPVTKDISAVTKDTLNTPTKTPPAPTLPTEKETWIAFIPVTLFLLVLIVTTIKVKADHLKLTDLLTEKDQTPPIAGVAPTSQQSVSRFIAFLTGFTALIIAISLTTFYLYEFSMDHSTKVDFSNLSTVIWGLGIGVLPYGFNKAAAAIKQS